MTTPAPSRRLRMLFTAALLGTHVVIAIALLQVHPLVALSYLLVTTLGLTLVVLRARAVPEPSGRTCDCCTSTVFDPVTVIEEKVQ